jgi:hypothetical protein
LSPYIQSVNVGKREKWARYQTSRLRGQGCHITNEPPPPPPSGPAAAAEVNYFGHVAHTAQAKVRQPGSQAARQAADSHTCPVCFLPLSRFGMTSWFSQKEGDRLLLLLLGQLGFS